MAILGAEVLQHGISGYSQFPYGSFSGKTADVTAPILTSAIGSSTGAATAQGQVTTDEGNGTLYWVVTQSVTTPTVAQIKAGQDDLGAAADDSGSQAVSGTGAQTVNSSGLSQGTTYYFHFVQTDAATNDSNAITSNAFTPAALPLGSLGLLGAGK
jgi:hypothetical protein